MAPSSARPGGDSTAPRPFSLLSFDCFGTLVDWRRGLADGLARQGVPTDDAGALERFFTRREAAERGLQAAEPGLAYRTVLARSTRDAVREVWGIALSPESADAIAAGQRGWPAWPDAPAALARLDAAGFPLALLSNCDEDVLLDCAREVLGLDEVLLVASSAVGSYKPAPGHWEALLRATGLPPDAVLHASAYATYDHVPARALGFAVAHVARPGAEAPDFAPDLAVADLADLADRLGA